MINGKRVAVVLPAYNAEKTLELTVSELPDLVDMCILVDDHSSDRTVEVAHRLGLKFFVHDQNYGYGSAGAIILTLIILIFTLFQGRLLGFGRSE